MPERIFDSRFFMRCQDRRIPTARRSSSASDALKLCERYVKIREASALKHYMFLRGSASLCFHWSGSQACSWLTVVEGRLMSSCVR